MNTKAHQSAARGAQWLLNLLQPDGSLAGSPPLDAYYKTPSALLASGHAGEANRVMDFVASRLLKADGDLDGTGVPWYDRFRIYPHAWLACGAVQLKRPDISERLVRFLRARWNPESGGFLADANGTEEMMTTSMAALACLWAGQMDIAHGAAIWLDRVMAAQPDLRRGLYHVWKPGHGLVEGDGSVWYLVNAAEEKQWYFQYGLSAAFLSEYSRRANHAPSLALAQKFLHASAYCREDVYRRPQSGKIGWGAAWTYALTHDPADAALVPKVIDGLCDLQCGDGSWTTAGVYEAVPTDEPARRMDITAEFVALLSFMENTPIV